MAAAIVLAAGESKRMACCKATLPAGSTHFLGLTLQALTEAGLSPIVIVAGKHRKEIESAVSAEAVRVVYNPHWQEGQIRSLQRGLEEVPPDQPVVVALIDHPGFSSGLVRSLLERYESEQAAGVIPAYQGQTGHPVVFGPEMTAALRRLPSGKTARDGIASFGSRVIQVETDEEAVVRDIDTEEDYQAFLALWKDRNI